MNEFHWSSQEQPIATIHSVQEKIIYLLSIEREARDSEQLTTVY